MDVVLLATIALMVLIGAIAAGMWAHSRSARPVLGGLGLLLIPLGLYLLGIMRLAYNGVVSIIDWLMRTAWDSTMSWGLGLAGAGVVLMVIASFIKVKPRDPKPAAPKPAAGAPASRPSVAGAQAKPVAGNTPKAQPAKAAGKAAPDPEDAEIEAILRKRGIM